MNLEAHSSLWSSIQQFPLDDPGAAINFSRKLAAQQNWSPAFTQQAIEEYRKFIFLCCIAPNGASPSKVVDEVWHLHLTYTQSYWINFCKNTLGKDIHHHPSKGGNEENHKHEQWYYETLQLYESVFGSVPPADIWPPPNVNPPQIPKSRFHLQNKTKALIILAVTLPFLLIAALYQTFDPFSLKGPQFLVFFPLLVIGTVSSFLLFHQEKRRRLIQLVTENFPTDATVYQLAQFLYGKHRAVQTAIVDMVRRDLLGVTKDKSFLIQKNRNNHFLKEQNPLMAGYLGESGSSVKYEMIYGNWYNQNQLQHPSLEYLYQLAYTKEPFFRRFNFLLIPLVISLMRLVQGISLGNPVAFLVLETMAYVIIALVVAHRYYVKNLVFKAIIKLWDQHHAQGLLHADEVVSNYALTGKHAINTLSYGLLMIGIFAPYPALDYRRIEGNDQYAVSSCSGCGAAGGDSGGGSYGSAGCGGCGGGGGD